MKTREEWRPIPGYESLYEASNRGRVRSKDRIVRQLAYNGSIATHVYRGRILTPKKSTHGYLKVDLAIDGGRKEMSIHRLVAMAFLPNPDNLPCINHKDEVRSNNNVENLEWCTQSHNLSWGNAPLKLSRTNTKHPVLQMAEDGTIINRFISMKDATIATGVSRDRIYACCAGYTKHGGRFRWKYDTGASGGEHENTHNENEQ